MKKKNKIEKFKRKIYNTIDIALSARNYEHHEAIGECLDNSIANRFYATTKKILEIVTAKIDYHEDDELVIDDDGSGQDAQGLADAWGLGKPNTVKNSRFGVGLNQATPALGKRVTLEAKKAGENVFHRFVFDKEKVVNNVKLVDEEEIEIENIPIEDGGYKKEDHFFKITINGLYRKPTRNNLLITKNMLASYFGTYIREKEMKIIFNGEELVPSEPPELEEKVEFDCKKFGLHGWWGITKKHLPGRVKDFGPDTFYNGRVTTISDLDIIKASKHPNYYRLEAEINFVTPTIFDNNVTSSKNGWIKDENYEQVQEWLKENIKDAYMKKLEKVRENEKETEATGKIKCANIASSKMLRMLFPSMRADKKEKIRAKKGVEILGEDEFEIEQRRNEGKKRKKTEGGEPTEWDDKRKPRKKHRAKRGYTHIYIDGELFHIEIEPVYHLDEYAPRYASELNEKEGILKIEINMNNEYVINSSEADQDSLLIEVGTWVIEAVLVHAFKIKDVEELIRQREEKISEQDWNNWLNDIDAEWLKRANEPESSEENEEVKTDEKDE